MTKFCNKNNVYCMKIRNIFSTQIVME